MRKSGTPTKYPGVFRVGNKKHRVRAKALCPRTGKAKVVERLLHGVSAHEAARVRAEIIEEIRNPVRDRKRVRVGEFAQTWMKSKALRIGTGTARTYADALDSYILPEFGDVYYDAIRTPDVQDWVDRMIQTERVTKKEKHRRYSVTSVHGWYRVFRTMTRDAMEPLGLQHDPTLRVQFPPATERPDSNALSADELARFLDAMRAEFPQHHALTLVLAYTGLRFCHASALRWEDWNEDAAVIHVARKQVRGVVGPISQKKQAPRQVPVQPELATALREHRHRLLAEQAPGLAAGWMFPSAAGTLRAPSSLTKAWRRCCAAAGIAKRFTVHGLRYTFNDLVRRANVDAVVRRSLTGHVTEEMQRHYSNVGLDEKRAAIAGVIRLIPTSDASGVNAGVNAAPKTRKAGES